MQKEPRSSWTTEALGVVYLFLKSIVIVVPTPT
jgi:hypothetical protein